MELRLVVIISSMALALSSAVNFGFIKFKYIIHYKAPITICGNRPDFTYEFFWLYLIFGVALFLNGIASIIALNKLQTSQETAPQNELLMLCVRLTRQNNEFVVVPASQ